MRTELKAITIIGLLIALMLIVESVDFYDPVTIGDLYQSNLTKGRSSSTLVCRWNATEDTSFATVTWYKNNDTTPADIGQYDNPDNTSNEYFQLLAEVHEEETWNCTVTLTNSSGNTTTKSDTIYIDYDPSVYINGVLVDKNYTFIEEQVYTVYWNTTNNKSLDRYWLYDSGTILCSGSDGTATCSPDDQHLGNDKNTSGNEIIHFKYDYNSLTKTQTNIINFTIIAVNDKPDFSTVNGQTNETIPWNITINVTDVEGNFPITFSYDIPSFCTPSSTSNSITLNCLPEAEDGGENYTINITATDSAPTGINNESKTKNFTLEVLRMNHNPNITYVSNFNSTQGLNYTIIMNATDRFDDNQLTFSITTSCSLSNPWSNVTYNTILLNESGNITSYGTGIWNNTLTNNHIVCRNITITVNDGLGGTNATKVYLNISNKNDPPVIENYSSNPGDMLNNHYIYNLTGYELAPFLYQIQITDPDSLVTYDPNLDDFNDTWTYTSNDTWLSSFLNDETGLISIPGQNMTKNSSNYSFLITVTDNGPLIERYSNTSIMNMELLENNPPTFTQNLNFTCFEFDSVNNNVSPGSCNFDLNLSATDTDPLDRVANFSDDSSTFNVENNGLLLFNATQSLIGEHNFTVTITDTRGATANTTMYLYINNTNNKPNITNIEVRNVPTALYYQIPSGNTIQIFVTDLDEDLDELSDNSSRRYKYETLVFNWSNNNQSNQTQNLTPYISIDQSSRVLVINTTKLAWGEELPIGSYSINVTVQDNYYNFSGDNTTIDFDTYTYSFTIYNDTASPEITRINPYGKPWNNTTVFDWKVISSNDSITYINISENQSMTFRHNATDENPDTLSYMWFYDGARLNTTNNLNYNSSLNLIDNNASITIIFGFFEARPFGKKEHNLTLSVIDGVRATLNDTFTWNINVSDVNRPSYLKEAIPNISILGSRNIENYDLWTILDTYGFYDPDADFNGDGVIEIDEGNFSITYSIPEGLNGTLCQGYATINVSDPHNTYISQRNESLVIGHGIRAQATGTGNGTCNMTFTAHDGEFNATSNIVFINVTVLGSEAPETVEVTDGRKTTTITVTETVTIPIPEEVEKPIPIDIVLPDMVTVYENNTIDVPLTLTNTWNKSISGIHLDYKINESMNYSIKFSRQNFFRIEPGEIMKTIMTISNYRVGGIYEILVVANVTDPAYVDTAKIYLNSIEQTSTGAQVRTLIKFARDLLQRNKECQELGEVLNKAEETVKEGELKKAIEIVDSVINGCKYLISEEQQRKQTPKRFRNLYLPLKKKYLAYLLGLAVIGLLGVGGYNLFKKKD